MYRYVTKQFDKDKEKGRYQVYGDVLSIWNDYIKDLIKLKIDVKKNICPKNVFDSHNNFQKQIKYLEDKRLDEAIKANLKARELMIYKDEDFIIRPAVSSKEIVEEGKALHHCVGGYVNKYAEGRTNILFLRNIDEEDTPFYTVEVSTDFKVLQVRGYKNKSATEDIDLFIDSYKDNVLNELRKQKVKIKAKIKVA
ncbi:MAG: PcfJ domain-containing protein [Clostridium sp.]|uniref:PcfJ domain-containing protein n=1 Tax=Clostridium sp. TaxID=1506 RepID=UPI003F33ED93